MKTLLILRHAKSSWEREDLSDPDRPLAPRGKRDAPRMGELLRKQALLPDLLLTSTAKRARATAELVAEAAGYSGDIRQESSFYMAGTEEYLEALQALPDAYEQVMIVGHNPGLEVLLEDLTGEWEHLPTAALAQVELPIEHWRELTDVTEGRLAHLWTPRALT